MISNKFKVNFKKAKSRMSAPIYTVHHVLMYHTKLSNWLANFHGLATKYLNNFNYLIIIFSLFCILSPIHFIYYLSQSCLI